MDGDLRGLFYKGTGNHTPRRKPLLVAGGRGRIAKMVFRECLNQRFGMFEGWKEIIHSGSQPVRVQSRKLTACYFCVCSQQTQHRSRTLVKPARGGNVAVQFEIWLKIEMKIFRHYWVRQRPVRRSSVCRCERAD